MRRNRGKAYLLLVLLALFLGAVFLKSFHYEDGYFRPGEIGKQAGSRFAGKKLVPEVIPGLGWKRKGDIEVFPRERIADKIDGAVVDYERYGVKELVFASYSGPGNKNKSVDLYIFRMGSVRDAFGILSFLKPLKYEKLEIGDEAWRDGASVFFRIGPFCVQSIGSSQGREMEEAAVSLAREAARKAGKIEKGNDLFPLEFLPDNGRLAGTEGYFRENAFEYPFLSNVFKADYGDEPASGFVMEARDFEGARRTVEEWKKRFSPGEIEGSMDGVEDSFLGRTESGFEGGGSIGRWVFGVIGFDNKEKALSVAKGIIKRIKENSKWRKK